MAKKTVLFALSILLIAAGFAMFSGCGSQGNITGETTAAKTSPLFAKPVTLRLMTPNSPSWPYQKDWYALKMIREKTNVSFEWITINEDQFEERLNTMMASGDVPDKGIQETDRMAWMYRKDIFGKHGLKVPANETEFLDVLRQLKKLYPDSYPYAERGLDRGMGRLEFLAGGWNTSFCGNHPFYYDYDRKEWRFGPIENNFRDMLAFYHQMLEEGLMPPDTLTLDTKAWQDIVSTNRAFITFEYLGRIDFFNMPMREENPEFTFVFMAPPRFGANGTAKNAFTAYAYSGWSLSANSPKLKDALKYMNWMYTPKAKELLSWGEEGETYEIADGQKRFIGVHDIASMRRKYGLSVNGTYALFDFDSHNSLSSKELSEAIVESRKYDMPQIPSVSLTDEEIYIYARKFDVIKKRVSEDVSQFLLGDKPIGEFDSYVAEIQSLGIQELLDIYAKAYERQNKGTGL